MTLYVIPKLQSHRLLPKYAGFIRVIYAGGVNNELPHLGEELSYGND